MGGVGQQSPTFLAPVMGFVEDNFSRDQGWGDNFRMIHVHHIQAHLSLFGPVPNRTPMLPVHGPGGWEPLGMESKLSIET